MQHSVVHAKTLKSHCSNPVLVLLIGPRYT